MGTPDLRFYQDRRDHSLISSLAFQCNVWQLLIQLEPDATLRASYARELWQTRIDLAHALTEAATTQLDAVQDSLRGQTE
jgi:hypothetical protein